MSQVRRPYTPSRASSTTAMKNRPMTSCQWLASSAGSARRLQKDPSLS